MSHQFLTSSLLVLLAGVAHAADPTDTEFFEKQVRPILVNRCYECHSGELSKSKGGLRLDSKAAVLKGGDTGPAIVPGNPQDSLLIDAVNYGELYQMPPKSRLPADEIAVLTKWIETGAPWPENASASLVPTSLATFDLQRRKAEHWCWQPVKSAAPPPVKNEAWVRQPLDRFILARLEERGFSPAPPADDQTLIRRAHFDVIGLPPPLEVLKQYVDNSPSLRHSLPPSLAADGETERRSEWHTEYEALIDELLASPHFGERWARHWLDLVRYSESRGHEFDYTIPNAFEYRDYVIRALNADVPYDQFLTEHVAGDLLNEPRRHPREGFNESIIATGYWFLGEWCHSPVDIRKDECDRVDNMLDVFSKTFLGVTVACARCHDHKFDAISQSDYYALAGYLKSSSYRLTRFETWPDDQDIAAKVQALNHSAGGQLATQIASALKPRVEALAQSLLAIEDSDDRFGVLESDLRGGKVIADYANLSADQWMTDGPLFGRGPVRPGQLVMTGDTLQPLEVAEYGAARRDPLWPDLSIATGSENDAGRLAGWVRAGRTLKTPTFTLDSGYLHYLIEGVGHVYAVVDSHAMINGPLHAELIKETGGNSDVPMRWVTHDLSRYVGHRLHVEFSPKEDEDFRILIVADSRERPAAPAPRSNSLLRPLVSLDSPSERRAAAQAALEETLDRLAESRIAGDSHARDRAKLTNWLISQAISSEPPPPAVARLLAEHQTSLDALTAKIRPASRVCLAMWDGTAVDEHLLIRGNHKTVGPVVPRRSLEAFERPGTKDEQLAGSGRLELAKQLVDPSNPLVSRVIVNRVWQHLMGRGIVASVDNFGVLGASPTHPELLDYLADEFIRDGWSLKRLIRRIMLSSTYRQGSGVRGQGSGIDPENLLFHRQNVKRLEGEAIRDAILAVSSSLNTKQYGPSVPVYLTPFMQGRGRPKDSGPQDGDGRRSVYIAVRRNFLSPLMVAFDTPLPFTTIGRRNVSNVPAQALILMNDPFVSEQALLWASSQMAYPAGSTDQRIRRMYLAAFHREPTSQETSAANAFLCSQAGEYDPSIDPAQHDQRVWADLAHVLYNVKEFLLVN